MPANILAKIGKVLPIVSLLCLPFLTSEAAPGEGDAVVQRVQAKFKELKSLAVHFNLRYETEGSESSTEEAGRLWIEGEKRFRMESPSQTIVSDGSRIWSYNPAEKQVIIYRADEAEGSILTPGQLLYEYPDRYRIESVGKADLAGRSCDLLVMIPRSETDPTRVLKVWVDRKESLTRRFLLEDLAGNVTIFDFEDFQLNTKIPDQTFQFTSPEGVEVIDMR